MTAVSPVHVMLHGIEALFPLGERLGVRAWAGESGGYFSLTPGPSPIGRGEISRFMRLPWHFEFRS